MMDKIVAEQEAVINSVPVYEVICKVPLPHQCRLADPAELGLFVNSVARCECGRYWRVYSEYVDEMSGREWRPISDRKARRLIERCGRGS